MILQNSTDVKTEIFYDENKDPAPVDVRYEKHIVNPNGLIQLQNIPSPLHTVFDIRGKDGVTVIKYNKVEVISSKYDFTVDYINGILTFHNSQVGKEIQVSYTNSIGRLNISADRVFTKIDSQGNVVKTLGTLLEEGRQTLSDLEVLGGATKAITELKGYIESVKELTGNIIEGDSVNTKLIKSTDTAKTTNNTLNSTIKNANTQIDDMNSWVESHGDIVDLDNRVDNAEGKLNIVSTQLADMTSEFKSRRFLIENIKESTKGVGDFANYAGQGLGSSAPIGFVIHHYTDGIVAQIDNVGENNDILILKNAVNPIRRPDKASSFSGTGKYLSCVKQNGETKNNYLGFLINQDFNLWWSGTDGNGNYNQPVKFSTNKDASGVPAYIFESSKDHPYFMRYLDAGVVLLDIKKNGTRLDLVNNIAGGIYIETPALRFKPTNGVTDFIGDFRVGDGTSWFYPIYSNKFCTSTTRPSTGIKAGDIYMETDTNKTIRRNSANNGWVDMNGIGI